MSQHVGSGTSFSISSKFNGKHETRSAQSRKHEVAVDILLMLAHNAIDFCAIGVEYFNAK